MAFDTTESSAGERPAYESHTSFREYHIRSSGLSNLELILQDKDKPQLHIETSLYNPGKPDITLHHGSDAKGLVLGDVDLKNFSGHYTIELGDAEHGAVVLEELDRIKGFKSQHQFQFIWAEGKRENYVWRHPGEMLLANRDDMELVTDDDESEVVLAKFLKGGGSGGWKSKGALLIREGGGHDWELMVILTSMALIVTRRREQ